MNLEEGETSRPHIVKESLEETHQPSQRKEVESSSTPNTTASSTLPEIEFDFGEDNFLVDPDQLLNVFDDNNNNGDDEYEYDGKGRLNEQQSEVEVPQSTEDWTYIPHIDEFPLDIELETEQLYEELAEMSLSETKNHMEEGGMDNGLQEPFAADPSGFEEIPTGNDGLPFYLWCQPCDVIGEQGNDMEDPNDLAPLDPSLPPIAEDHPLDEVEAAIVRQAQRRHTRDLQDLYKSSQRQRQRGGVGQQSPHGMFNLDPFDPLIQELEAQSIQDEKKRLRDAAQQWTKAFGVNLDDTNDENENDQTNVPAPSKNILKMCIGHKETIYGVDFSHDGKYIATASEDSTINVWETAKQRLLTTLKGHSTDYECLRVTWASPIWANEILDRGESFPNILASSGADGIVKVWAAKDVKNGWKCEYSLDHGDLLGRGVKQPNGGTSDKTNDQGDKPQVYALQFIDHWKVFTKLLQDQQCQHQKQSSGRESSDSLASEDIDRNSFLMTSADEFIHLWEVEGHPFDRQLQFEDKKIRLLQDSKIKLKEVMSLHFGSLEQYSYGVTICTVTGQGLKLPPPPNSIPSNQTGGAFGGERNPQNIVFVFDAEYSPASGLLGVALSDGSLRLVNGRGICISILNLPGNQSHLTSFCWDSTGSRLATCVAKGFLITWSLDLAAHQGGDHYIVATCTGIFEGGHDAGRPLFGSRFCGSYDENLLVSWGIDGKICVWGSYSQGNIYAPVAILKQDKDYPIYAVCISDRNVAIGGGRDGGFIGIPLYLAEIQVVQESGGETPKRDSVSCEEDVQLLKKPKT